MPTSITYGHRSAGGWRLPGQAGRRQATGPFADEVAKARRLLNRICAKGDVLAEAEEERRHREEDELATARTVALSVLDGHAIAAQTRRRES